MQVVIKNRRFLRFPVKIQGNISPKGKSFQVAYIRTLVYP